MDVPLDLSEIAYVEAQVRSGRAASEGEVLREALQYRMEHAGGVGQESEPWREAALERMRLRITAWKPAPRAPG